MVIIMNEKTAPHYSIIPCTDPKEGAKILCNGCSYLRTDMKDIPAEEHNEMAAEIVADLNIVSEIQSIFAGK